MGKYIKYFETHEQYELEKNSLELPNISFCNNQKKTVHYAPDIYNGHEYVDLDLPSGTKWATMNIGANSVVDYGLYFQWGDTSGYTASQVGSGDGQKYFSWTDYKFNSGGSSPNESDMTKYNSTDHKIVLDLSDDAARANWGGVWYMPTYGQFVELGQNTTSALTNNYLGSDIKCLVLTSKNNGKTLVLPVNGFCNEGSTSDVNLMGYYWTSTVESNNFKEAHRVLIRYSDVRWDSQYDRYRGFGVRAVAD